jgi:hypothetical protein
MPEDSEYILNTPASYSGDIAVEAGTIYIDVNNVDINIGDKFKKVIYNKEKYNENYKKEIVENIFDVNKGIFSDVYMYDYENMCREDLTTLYDYYSKLNDYAMENDTNYLDSFVSQQLEQIMLQLPEAKTDRELITDYNADEYVGYIGNELFKLCFNYENEYIAGFTLEFWLEEVGAYNHREGYACENISLLKSLGEFSELEASETDVDNNCSIDIQQARDKAIDFLDKCDINNIDIIEEFPLGWSYSGEETIVEYDGYCFIFSRIVDNNNVFLADTSLVDSSETEYTAENFVICVDDSGIIYANCLYSGTSYSETDIDLLNYNDALLLLQQNANEFYSEHDDIMVPDQFNYMGLYYVMMNGNDNSTYIYKPAWILALYDEIEIDLKSFDMPYSLLIVDAETGDIIDY